MSCLGSPSPEPSTVKGMGGDCMYLTDILKVPLISVPGNEVSGCSAQRPAPGGSREPAPSELVQRFEQCRVGMLSGCRAAVQTGTFVRAETSEPQNPEPLGAHLNILSLSSPPLAPWKSSPNKVRRQLPFAFCLICFGQKVFFPQASKALLNSP